MFSSGFLGGCCSDISILGGASEIHLGSVSLDFWNLLETSSGGLAINLELLATYAATNQRNGSGPNQQSVSGTNPQRATRTGPIEAFRAPIRKAIRGTN